MKTCRNIFVLTRNTGNFISGSRRTFSERSIENMANRELFDMKKEKAEFISSMSGIIESHVNTSKYNEVREVSERVKMVLAENLTGGKCYRGMTTLLTYKYLEKPENITDEAMHKARVVGWCTEFLQAYLIILDDIIDDAIMRRGKPAWHLRKDVTVNLAINDAIFVHMSLMELLKKTVGNLQNYGAFVDTFNDVLLYTSLGQYLDIISGEHKDYSLFTMDRYEAIVKYKAAYYTYKLPITLGLLLANRMDENTSMDVEKVSIILGKLFQMQDDYIDCFGDSKITGKLGGDIQERKCSWLAVKALELCNPRQRTVFTACYGSNEPAHIERIKQLYIQLQLSKHYRLEETIIYNEIMKTIESFDSDDVRQLFQRILNDTYKRAY